MTLRSLLFLFLKPIVFSMLLLPHDQRVIIANLGIIFLIPVFYAKDNMAIKCPLISLFVWKSQSYRMTSKLRFPYESLAS